MQPQNKQGHTKRSYFHQVTFDLISYNNTKVINRFFKNSSSSSKNSILLISSSFLIFLCMISLFIIIRYVNIQLVPTILHVVVVSWSRCFKICLMIRGA